MSITTTAEDRYVDVNESFVSLSGYKRDELIGHTAAEMGLLPVTEARAQLLELLNGTGSARNVETQLRTKSGELRVLLSSAEFIELDGERFLLIASSDITERKQAEQTILEAKTRALKEYERLIERIATLGLTDVTQWSWGTILYWAQVSSALLVGAWWWFVPAGLCIALVGTGLALVNFGIDEFINPRLRAAGLSRKAARKAGIFGRPKLGMTQVAHYQFVPPRLASSPLGPLVFVPDAQ